MQLRDGPYGKFYGCTRFPECDGIHGAHQKTGAPLGIPADKRTRQARIAAHDALDALWKSKRLTRNGAYHWMRQRFNLSKDEAHIGRFTHEQCMALIVAIDKRFGTKSRKQ